MLEQLRLLSYNNYLDQSERRAIQWAIQRIESQQRKLDEQSWTPYSRAIFVLEAAERAAQATYG